jgi:hypothetical protein
MRREGRSSACGVPGLGHGEVNLGVCALLGVGIIFDQMTIKKASAFSLPFLAGGLSRDGDCLNASNRYDAIYKKWRDQHCMCSQTKNRYSNN